MISDKETNTIYFSKKIIEDSRFINTANLIFKQLDSSKAKYKLLPDTKDIWVRDFMPIQISDSKFIEYRYDPDYLQGNWKGSRELKTYPDFVCNSMGLKTEKSDLILDGGNFVKSNDCIILTDKFIKENRLSYSKNELIKKLHETFQVKKVVLIPWDTSEEFGHSDGMLRFIDNDTVLLNDCYKSDSVIHRRLKQSGLRCESLNFKVKKQHKYNWAYINFLQTKDLILVPKFNVDEDEQALEQISENYPDYSKNKRIAQVWGSIKLYNMDNKSLKMNNLRAITWYSAYGFTPFGREKSSEVCEGLSLVNKSRCKLIGNRFVLTHTILSNNLNHANRKN